MHIIPAQKEHLATIKQLVKNEWGTKYEDMVEQEFKAECNYNEFLPAFFVAQDNKKVIGLITSMKTQFSDSVWCLSWLIVDPNYRKQGIAKALIDYAMEHIKKEAKEKEENSILVLLTTTDNLCNFYKNLGWKLLESYEQDDHKLFSKELKVNL